MDQMDNPDKCDLTTPFELHGEWWRSESDREKSVPGCLSYTPDYGLQLQLYGHLLGEQLSWLRGHLPDQPIWGEVAGFAGRRVKVSLFDEIQTNRPNDPDIEGKPSSHTIYFINRALLGTHATSTASLRFKSMQFSILDFEMFAGTRPIGVRFDGKSTKVDYAPDEPFQVRINRPDMLAKIVTWAGHNESLPARSCTITYQTEMAMTPSSPMPFDEGMETVFNLVNFYLLCARESVTLRKIRGVLDTGETISSFGLMKRRKGKRWSAREWLLFLNHLKGSFEDVLNRWFALVEKLGFVGHVFFSELSEPSPIQDARFFHFAGCLEAFHREIVTRTVGKFVERSEYKVIKKALLEHLPATTPEALKASMAAALSQANDHSFFERVEALFNSLEPETRGCLAEDGPRFLQAMKNSRNKLAHISDETRGETFEGREYAHASLSLRAWLTILLLKECGISESLIRDRMNAIGYFYWGPFKFDSPSRT